MRTQGSTQLFKGPERETLIPELARMISTSSRVLGFGVWVQGLRVEGLGSRV